MKRKLFPTLVLTLLSSAAVAANYGGSDTSNSGSEGMTSGSSSDRMSHSSKDASDHNKSMNSSGSRPRSDSDDGGRHMSQSRETSSNRDSHYWPQAQVNIPNEYRAALRARGIHLTPNMPIGEPGRLNTSEQDAMGGRNADLQIDENSELQMVLKQEGIHITPNRPTGSPGMLNSSTMQNSSGNSEGIRHESMENKHENMENKTRTMRAPDNSKYLGLVI